MKNINSIYIHIPFCLSKCKYCDFFSIPCNKNDETVFSEYVDAVLKELDFYIQKYSIRNLKSIYIGGGTPSLLSKSQLEKILNYLKAHITFFTDYEFTIEMNPDDITKDKLEFLQTSSINRISCGIQSLDDFVLKNVNRRAGAKENFQALELLKKYWHKTLSLDLISGLPNEKMESFIENLQIICDYNPHHISLYSLTIEDETKLGQEMEQGLFDYDYDFADEMWLEGKKLLEKNGYNQYEVSNFCKNNYECKHNVVYWTHRNYIGIGAGAAGSIYNSDGSGVRIANKNQIQNYIKFWLNEDEKNAEFPFDKISNIENVDLETSKFEFFMMGLRKAKGISDLEYKACFNEEIPESVILQFTEWKEKSLVEIKKIQKETFYSLNSQGILFLNKFLQELKL